LSAAKKPCVFCAIAADPSLASLVYADDHALAFLDTSPLFHGHTLVVPRAHYATLEDLPPPELAPYFGVVQRVTRAVREALDAGGTFVAVNNTISQSVPHLHVHVVPRRPKDGLRGFFWPRVRYESESARHELARMIAARM
jgi:histidine triad (HIT) family protein